MNILELFEPHRPTWSLTEIVEATELTTSTAHRICQALKERQLLVSDPISRRYSLGPGVMRLARSILQSNDIHAVQVAAAPHLETLRRLTDETVGLHCRIGDRRVCVGELQSHQPIRMATTVGGVQLLHTGAASKALLAWLPSHRVRQLLGDADLEPRTERSPRSIRDLEARLLEARLNGYATSFGESVAGATAVAAPIFGADGSRWRPSTSPVPTTGGLRPACTRSPVRCWRPRAG